MQSIVFAKGGCRPALPSVRWIGKFKRECLNRMVCVSLGQLDFITRTYEKFHNTHRRHKA